MDKKYKLCTRCKKEYPANIEYFIPSKRVKTGIASWCRSCKKEYDKFYGYEWRKKNKKKYLLAIREWDKKNPDKRKAIRLKHYYKNRERYIKYITLWRKNNPEKARQRISFENNKRRTRVLKAIGSHTTKEWNKLKKKYNYMCLCCKKIEPEIKLTRDHIIPLIKNGTDYIENIQPLCKSCNCKKHTKIINYKNGILDKQIK